MDNGLYYIALPKTRHTKHTQSVKLGRQILIGAGEFLDDDALCTRRYNFSGHLFIWMQHLFQARLSLDQQAGYVGTNFPILVHMENNHKTFRNAM